MTKNIAIIGAGLSGTVLYDNLKEKNHTVTLFEKSRGAGGRCSTRYIDDLKIDHGTSSFQVQDESFKEFCDLQVKKNNLILEDGYYKGVDGINKMLSSLIDQEDLITKTKIIKAFKKDSKWSLEDESGKTYGNFDTILLTIPATQVLELDIKGIDHIKEKLKDVTYDSVATLLTYGYQFNTKEIQVLQDNSFFRKLSVQKDGIVFHANPSISNQITSKDEVQKLLLDGISSIIKTDVSKMMKTTAHFWKYGFVSNSLNSNYIYDSELQFGLCGDYFKGKDLEASYSSAKALISII